MLTIILEDPAGNEIARAENISNAQLLSQVDDATFPLLAQVDEVSYVVFGTSDMNALEKELLLVGAAVSAPYVGEHVQDILRLVKQCREWNGATLTITPWGAE